MTLNESQKRAAEHKDGPCMVLAGPGSGKTATITQRTYNLITKYQVKPEEILVITFSKAAATEMRERFYQMSPGKRGVTFGTFHAVFFQILKLAYHMQSSNVVPEEKRYQKMREILAKYPIDFRDEKDMIQGIFSEISLVKNTRMDLTHFYSNQCGEDIFRRIYKDYEVWLKNNRLIDFDDMLTYTYELFVHRKDILAAWQRKFRYILIDEFQDINTIQYEIIRMLALPENNLYIVGDDDQSIYRFRGSKPEIMLGFKRDYPNAKQMVLDVNYRCDANILTDAKRLIAHNKSRYEKPVHAAKAAKNPVVYYEFQEQEQEHLKVLQMIEQGRKNGRKFSDYAVLFRTNIQPRRFMDLLMRYQIPFRIREHVPDLFEHWITKDIMTYIRCGKGSRMRKDFLQIMNRPKRYLSRDFLCEERVSFDEWEKRYEEQPWILERIEKLEADLNVISRMSPYAAINFIRKGIGYDEFLQEYAEYRNINVEDLFDTLEELHASAKGFASDQEWMKYIEDYRKQIKEMENRREHQKDAVSLMTFHSAKGLEFPCVFLCDVNEGIMPYKKAVLEPDLEEERRMFYVGMTRAIEELYICSVKEIRNKDYEMSRFIKEARGDL